MIIAGLIGLVAAVVCGYFARSANTRANSMERTETLPARELRAMHKAAADAAGPGQFRYQCEVVGAAREHKNGALKSELKKQSCVWHMHKITRKYKETSYRDGKRVTRTRNEVVSKNSSSTAFFVEDATGKMVIRPGQHEVVGAEKILDRFEPHRGGGKVTIGPLSLSSGSGTVGYKQEEWVVRAGRQLFVHGEASDVNGGLSIGAPVEGGVFIMSTKSQTELLHGENRKVLGFGIGAGVSALAGVVFLILGVVS